MATRNITAYRYFFGLSGLAALLGGLDLFSNLDKYFPNGSIIWLILFCFLFLLVGNSDYWTSKKRGLITNDSGTATKIKNTFSILSIILSVAFLIVIIAFIYALMHFLH
ncbi:MAG: hypothetical protein JWO40_109 [Candidatus Doudnabacteria bacterium]|nr:hypothetical protein [Candidatus Doudnabacteria bacterium]